MPAYNPYAYKRYDVVINTTNKSLHSQKQPVRKVKPAMYKYIVTAIAIAFIVTSLFMIRTTASTPNSDVPMEGEPFVTVSAGDSLWTIATRHYEDISDKGYAVFLIKERNAMNSNTIMPGDQLILPVIP